jgi:circadian clock protein KaiA
MILPILLICPVYIKKHLYNPAVKNQQQWLIHKSSNFIARILNQLLTAPLALINPITINNLQYGNPTNNNSLLTDNYQSFHVLACDQQKNQQWFQDMSPAQKQETLKHLKSEYREILIDYFISDQNLKIKIDKFINGLFYANIPVLQIIEMHMELIDEFSKQLKLEGRSDETLLDYRLTLIDILANLCEVYRCSISKIN